MLSNSCRYGIRAVIYLAGQGEGRQVTGIKKISADLNLPAPFLAKILQMLARKKILNSVKGPHGGFSLLKKASEITLAEIISTIDGEEVFTGCIMHNGTCRSIDRNMNPCPIHDDYSGIRAEFIDLVKNRTIDDLIKKANASDEIVI
ncbi:MAG: Rrf2 family transcriptional regulator [Bacteroidales bacterium]|nr:Rrf2 family transcriptional regulator [Bacteroidales bacterium]